MQERKRIGLREIKALMPGDEIWDQAVAGFGARRRSTDAVSYILMYRTAEGRQRRFTIGRHGSPWTPETARDEARRLLGSIVDGGDPAADKQAKRKAETVNELCDLYWSDAQAGRLITRRRTPKKASTLLSDKGRIDKHIRPLLGRMRVAAVTPADIEDFMHAVAAGKTAARAKTGKKRGLSNVRGGIGAASRTVGLLGAVFTYAVRHRMRSDNPVHGIMRPASGQRERRLTDSEYAQLGEALRASEEQRIWPAALAATRFLALTGWRSGEALGLRRAEVDLARRTVLLPDTKAGRSMRPLSHAACDVLRSVGGGAPDSLLFPPIRGTGSMTGFRKLWNRIISLGELPADITPHTLRHSFASIAADLGYSETAIATLLGHAQHSVTSKYTHVADAVVLTAADAVARKIAELMGEARTAEVIELRPSAA